MFPYPLEDQGGSNRNQFGQIIRLQLVSVPSRGLGGSDDFGYFFPDAIFAFPSPLEEMEGSNGLCSIE